MDYIEYKHIDAQESAEALCRALAVTFAVIYPDFIIDEDGVTVWVNANKKLGVRFVYSSTKVYATFVNPAGVTIGTSNSTSVTFSATKHYNLYYVITAMGTVAFGLVAYVVDDDLSKIVSTLTGVLAQNTKSEWTGILVYDGITVDFLSETADNALNDINMPPNASTSFPITLMKLPDIINGGTFNDVYYAFTTNKGAANSVYYLNGKYYRLICRTTGYSTLAIPVG